MAGKRNASSDLNHDNWDREEEAEEAGTFKRASADVLKRRVIKTAKRRAVGSLAEGSEGGEKKSIFGGFTAFSKATPDPSSAFSFLKNPPANTNGTEKKETPQTEVKTTQQTVCNLMPQPVGKSPLLLGNSSSGKKPEEYFSKLKGLNESVANWIKKHVDDNPFVSLKPIFADYEKYFDEIEADKKETSEPVFSKPKPEDKPMFSFGSNDSAQFSFGGNKEASPPKSEFTFGAKKPDAGLTEKPGFAFTASSAPFTFGNVAPTSPPKMPDKKTEDEEDEPPKVEFTPVVEQDHVYTTECKVFVKKDGNFGDRGLGTLYLKKVPDSEKYQFIVRANTNLGNLLCNFILSPAIPAQRLGKKDVMLVCIPTPESKPPPVPVLIRVKTPEKADELLNILKQHQK